MQISINNTLHISFDNPLSISFNNPIQRSFNISFNNPIQRPFNNPSQISIYKYNVGFICIKNIDPNQHFIFKNNKNVSYMYMLKINKYLLYAWVIQWKRFKEPVCVVSCYISLKIRSKCLGSVPTMIWFNPRGPRDRTKFLIFPFCTKFQL